MRILFPLCSIVLLSALGVLAGVSYAEGEPREPSAPPTSSAAPPPKADSGAPEPAAAPALSGPSGDCVAQPSPVTEPRAASVYGRLFAQGTCFRFKLTHRIKPNKDARDQKVQVRSTSVDCRVVRVQPRASALISEVRCVKPKNFVLTGSPPGWGPDLIPGRVYISTPKGLWWSRSWPRSETEVKSTLKDLQSKLFTTTHQGIHNKNVEDEDVSFTVLAQRDPKGRWCWEQTSRDDFVVVETLCFENGALVEATRSHEDGMDKGRVDTFVYKLSP